MRTCILLGVALALGGCATITRGTTDQVTINSDPPGAQARLSLGQACPATPCTFEVSRKSEFIVTFEKEGYLPQQVPVATKLAGAGAAGFAGNVLVGGLVGMGVDAATGSTLEHFPNPVFAALLPDPATRSKSDAPPRKLAKARARAFRPDTSDPPDLPF